MGKVTVLNYTTKHPISLIGEMSGICYGSNVKDELKNFQRGMNCIESQHGRTLEFPNVYLKIEGYSARVIREWYTHLGGSPTRLQASTRYINYKNFNYIIPHTINDSEEAKIVYINLMNDISDALIKLEKLGIPKEDSANGLPLGMTTTIVDKRNLRNLIDMSHQRMCNRAYWEFRELFADLCDELIRYSDEWKWIIENLFMPKCKYLGKCPEKKPCGKGVM